jgi:hypothetical protein
MGIAANPRTMKELIAYSELQKKLRADGHRRAVRTDGACGGLTDKEYNSITTRQKSNFAKARKFTHSRMWQETHKKFDTKQLSIIKKTL